MMTHSGFILAAYVLTTIVVVGLFGAIVMDHRALRRSLAKFPPREGADQ